MLAITYATVQMQPCARMHTGNYTELKISLQVDVAPVLLSSLRTLIGGTKTHNTTPTFQQVFKLL